MAAIAATGVARARNACRLTHPPRARKLRAPERAVSSAVEHCFHTAVVSGSIPLPPTKGTGPHWSRIRPQWPALDASLGALA